MRGISRSKATGIIFSPTLMLTFWSAPARLMEGDFGVLLFSANEGGELILSDELLIAEEDENIVLLEPGGRGGAVGHDFLHHQTEAWGEAGVGTHFLG